MVAIPFGINFYLVGPTPGGFPVGALALAAPPGPTLIEVNWGSTGPLGLDPLVVTYAPLAPGEGFAMPDFLDEEYRAYANGSYTIRAVATFADLSTTTELFNVFVDIGNPFGVARTGNGRDDAMIGGSGNDSFSGTGGDDWLAGGRGADWLSGGDGNDILTGSSASIDEDNANDTLVGGNGLDGLYGGGGNDSISGGADSDAAYGDDGQDTMRGDDGDDLLFGGSHDDVLTGGNGADTLFGDDLSEGVVAGADTMIGGAGNDDMDGGDGDDLLSGNGDNDNLTGGFGNDTLNGNDGDDFLYGYVGADRLVGGTGFDRFNGGEGNDTLVSMADGTVDFFVYGSVTEGLDRISGFEVGIDKFLFTTLSTVDVPPARFVDSINDVDTPGIWIIYNPTNGLLSVDIYGAGTPGGILDIAVLIGKPALTYSDLILAA